MKDTFILFLKSQPVHVVGNKITALMTGCLRVLIRGEAPAVFPTCANNNTVGKACDFSGTVWKQFCPPGYPRPSPSRAADHTLKTVALGGTILSLSPPDFTLSSPHSSSCAPRTRAAAPRRHAAGGGAGGGRGGVSRRGAWPAGRQPALPVGPLTLLSWPHFLFPSPSPFNPSLPQGWKRSEGKSLLVKEAAGVTCAKLRGRFVLKNKKSTSWLFFFCF